MGSISHGGHERGKRGDGDLTRARILESAGQLAAECGYANMTSKQVCERAHVNMAAVNYHFGSREGLYAAVLAEAHDRLFTLERLRQILAEGTAREKLSRTLDELLAHLHGPRSWHVRVLAREFFSPAGFVDPFLQEKVHPKARLLRGLLSVIPGGWYPVVGGVVGESAHIGTPDDLAGAIDLTRSWHVFATADLWIGAVVGVAFIAAAIRLRRWRDEG